MIQKIKCFFGYHDFLKMLPMLAEVVSCMHIRTKCRHCSRRGLIVATRKDIGSLNIVEFTLKPLK